MADYILIQNAQKRWVRAAKEDLPDESVLQQLIRDNPDVLPLDDLGDDIPPLLIVGRETQLANGFADVIGVDHDGLVTVIECKLDRNPEVKRKVIGQILGYGAYLWGMTFEQFEGEVARRYFDSEQCHRPDLRGIALDDAMENFRAERSLEGDWSKEAFRGRLEANLKSGRCRLIIVVDKVNDELRRTVEYLNACTGPTFQLLCAELRYFASKEAHLLVPALIGKPAASKPPSESAPAASRWTPERFFPALRETKGAEAELVARRLLEWVSAYSDRVYWGTGAKDGSFNLIIEWQVVPKLVANVMAVWTYGRLEIGFAYVKPYTPFDREEKRREWLERLNRIAGVKLPDDAINARPGVPLTIFAGEREFQQLTDTMGWVVDELRAARDKANP